MSNSKREIVFGEGKDSCVHGALALFVKNDGGTVIFLKREDHFYYYPPGADPDTVGAENLGEVVDEFGKVIGTIFEPLTQTEALSQGGIDQTLLIKGWTERPYIMENIQSK